MLEPSLEDENLSVEHLAFLSPGEIVDILRPPNCKRDDALLRSTSPRRPRNDAEEDIAPIELLGGFVAHTNIVETDEFVPVGAGTT